jgi:hypothetical protein
MRIRYSLTDYRFSAVFIIALLCEVPCHSQHLLETPRGNLLWETFLFSNDEDNLNDRTRLGD